MIAHEVTLSYDDQVEDIAKVAHDLGNLILQQPEEDSYFVRAAIRGLSADVFEIQRALNQFFCDNAYTHRVHDMCIDGQDFVIAMRLMDVHELIGFF